jgi:putative ABC transport system substrate-binding protein
MNNRRRLLVALGAGALVAPMCSFAQQPRKIWRVGFLALRHVNFVDTDYYYNPFRQGMRELGYVDGKNLVIEWRSAEGKSERLLGLATELVNLKVDVIVAAGTTVTGVAKKATTIIPIVMVSVGDPVGDDFVVSLARPGGNITGLSNLNVDIGPKRLEMLLSIVPKLSRVAILVNPSNTANIMTMERVQAVGKKRGVTILLAQARTSQEIESAFSTMTSHNAEAVIVASDAFFNQQVRQIAELAAKHRLPSISAFREYAENGVLMTYGANIPDLYRRAATYVDKILKGARPADLSVEQPAKFELVINLKTAKMLGLTIPQSLLLQADHVIQ